MMYHRFLFFVFVLLCQLHYGQFNDSSDTLERYREDQVYLGVSFIQLINKDSNFNQNGLSSDFQFGFVRDMPLVASGKFAFGLGIGYGQQQFNSNLLRLQDSQNLSFYTYQNLDDEVDKMKFSFKSLVVPVVFRWRTSTTTTYKFWRVYTGLKFRWTFSSYATNNNERINIKRDIRPWTTEGFISLGYNTWNLYLGYELNSIFNQSVLTATAESLSIQALKFGLIFYLF